MTAKIPPHAIDAEQAVLGGVMLRPESLEEAAAILTEDDFYRRDHRLLWRAICDLDAKGQPFDAVTMADWIVSNNLSELIGGVPYVMDLANNTPGGRNVAIYARIVRDKSILRRMIDVACDVSEGAYAPGDKQAGVILDDAIRALMALNAVEARHEFTARDAARIAVNRLHEAHEAGGKLQGITTGLVDLDEKLGGFHPSDLIVIGGRAAMGKTSFLLNAMRAAASSGAPVGLISGEQPVDQVAMRIASAESRISAKRFRTADFDEAEWTRVIGGITSFGELPIFILDRSAPTLAEVVRVSRRWVHQHGIKALYVDYLQRIAGEGERKFEQVGYVARGLKNLARDLNIPVITLAQVSRAVEGRSSQKPRMGDLSDSSEIEKEADQILMLFRPGYYDNSADQGKAEIVVEKNRHGPTGFVEVAWLPETMEFANLTRDAWAA